MKKNTPLVILFVVCSLSNVIAQRVVDLVATLPTPTPGITFAFNGVVVDDHVFIAGYEGLYKYDGISTVRCDYPVRDGARLTISGLLGGTNIDTWTLYHNRALPVLNSIIYLNLTTTATSGCGDHGVCSGHLYQFVGGVITPSPITEETLSNVVVFQNRIYVVVKSGDVSKLVSFDGTTVREVISSFESHDVVTLFSKDEYLYLIDHKFNGPRYTDTDVFVKRFNGSTFIDIPPFDLPYSFVREVHQKPGVETVYFHSEADITSFDGSTITEIVSHAPIDHFGFADFENTIYFITYDVPSLPVLYYYNGSSVEVLTLPDGARILGSPEAILVYEGSLFFSAILPSGEGITYRYDGTTFSPFFAGAGRLYEREGKLVIQSDPSSHEYYRGTFCTIRTDNFWPRTNLATTDFYMWWKNVNIDGVQTVRYGVERKTGCGGSSIIPGAFIDFERVDITTLAPERDWCWTGIDVDWVVNPICPTPPICFDQLFQISMTDINNTPAFQKKFSKPAEISIPLADKQPYDLSLELLNNTNQSFQNVLTMDKELIPSGISEISLSMKPKNGQVIIRALTDKGKEVPFQIALLNKKGTALWQEDFVAPISKEITARVKETGTNLRFSAIPTKPESKVNKAGLNVKYYPNPVIDKITVELNSEKETPVHFSIYSIQGELVQHKMLNAPGTYTLEIDSKNKQGLYILSIRLDNEELRELIELRR